MKLTLGKNGTYSLEALAFKTIDDRGRFLSCDLYAEGKTLDELLENASYMLIDQDGDDVGEEFADDSEAQDAIERAWNKQGGK